MTEQRIILSRLLDKFENSKHLSEPGTSHRRVMLRVDKKELPEYRYEDATTRDAYNEAARILEARQMVQLEWIKDRPLLSTVVLNLEQVSLCYTALGRAHPKARANHITTLIDGSLEGVSIPWIVAWKEDICSEAVEHLKIPNFCKFDDTLLHDLLRSFQEYATLPGSITMRAFSIKCFSDTKYFERNIRDLFLRIARKYDNALAIACEENNLGEKEQLAFLGIYARPEHYELAGNCLIRTQQGELDLKASGRCGLALPSTLIDSITEFEMSSIDCITFIENKTNYDEYIASEKQSGELVIYHGGFLSPQKRHLFTLIANGAAGISNIRFWADIDKGGFQMFQQLQELIPALVPMRMAGELVDKFHKHGLVRSKEYLSALKTDLNNGKYLLFKDAIERILNFGVTIEQEAFLN